MLKGRAIKTLTFPIQYLEIGEALAREHNQDVEGLYRLCGITLPRPFMPWQTINGQQMQIAMTAALRLCPAGPPPLVSFMAHFPVTTHGPLGMLAITSSTLGEALEGAIRYAPLVMPAYAVRLQNVVDEVHVIFERLCDFGAINDFFTEIVVASLLKIKPFLSREPSQITVYLTNAPLGPPEEYEAALGAKFVFQARQNKIVIARQDMSTPLITPSRASHLMIQATLEQQRQARANLKPFTQEVKRLLQSAVRQNLAIGAEEIAQSQAMSVRTLSRRLKDECNTLPQLRTEVGIEYAEVLLIETDKTITQIAHTAGFTDAAAFTRAFKRTTGQTPSQLRSGAATGTITGAAGSLTD
ncbi:MAG: AraC family transcriptional regulator ligand-binding domain-containing protein [Aquabacterium sp.]|nr:AraC family transcriptional regulator ligand-binding domain-containing protein [Aquabacterium sp.]